MKTSTHKIVPLIKIHDTGFVTAHYDDLTKSRNFWVATDYRDSINPIIMEIKYLA